MDTLKRKVASKVAKSVTITVLDPGGGGYYMTGVLRTPDVYKRQSQTYEVS